MSIPRIIWNKLTAIIKLRIHLLPLDAIGSTPFYKHVYHITWLAGPPACKRRQQRKQNAFVTGKRKKERKKRKRS
jgi:hypothetical protein